MCTYTLAAHSFASAVILLLYVYVYTHDVLEWKFFASNDDIILLVLHN